MLGFAGIVIAREIPMTRLANLHRVAGTVVSVRVTHTGSGRHLETELRPEPDSVTRTYLSVVPDRWSTDGGRALPRPGDSLTLLVGAPGSSHIKGLAQAWEIRRGEETLVSLSRTRYDQFDDNEAIADMLFIPPLFATLMALVPSFTRRIARDRIDALVASGTGKGAAPSKMSA